MLGAGDVMGGGGAGAGIQGWGSPNVRSIVSSLCGSSWLALALPCRPHSTSARGKLERDSPPEARGVGAERGVGPDGERRASEQRAHGRSRNLDRRRDSERIGVRGERGEGCEADQEGPRAREPHPPRAPRDRERVATRDIVVSERGREEPPVEWAHARSGPGLQEVLRDEAEGPEVGRGQVAAAVSEIARDVTEHVRHLEGLAEAHALLTLLAQVPTPEAWAVGGVQNRPEGADAAGDEVRVAVELVERVEGGQARGMPPRGGAPRLAPLDTLHPPERQRRESTSLESH